MAKIQEFNVEKSTKTVAICNCPIGANSFEINTCRNLFKAAMGDMHIEWDAIKQVIDGQCIVFVATRTSLEIKVC